MRTFFLTEEVNLPVSAKTMATGRPSYYLYPWRPLLFSVDEIK